MSPGLVFYGSLSESTGYASSITCKAHSNSPFAASGYSSGVLFGMVDFHLSDAVFSRITVNGLLFVK